MASFLLKLNRASFLLQHSKINLLTAPIGSWRRRQLGVALFKLFYRNKSCGLQSSDHLTAGIGGGA